MKKLTLLIALLASAGFLFSQITFEKTYEIEDGYNGICIEETPDNGFAVLTNESDLQGFPNSILKIDCLGELDWVSPLSDHGLHNMWAMCMTPDSGFMLTGGLDDYNQFKVAKYDKNGDTSWVKSNLLGPYDIVGQSIIQTSDENYLIGVNTFAGSFLVKINEDGDTLWTGNFNVSADLIKLLQLDNGDIVICGHVGWAPSSLYITKIDSLGNLKWFNTISSDLWPESFCLTDDGGYVLTGGSNSGVPFMKVDSVCNVVWENFYDPGLVMYASGHSICVIPEGGYVIAAEADYHGGGYLIKVDESGEIIWSYPYGDNLSDVKVTSDNGLIATGSKNGDLYLIKTTLDGLITSINENSKQNMFDLELYPNPASQNLFISYNLEKRCHAEISIYDLNGEIVKKIIAQEQLAGKHKTIIKIDKFSPGTYYCRLQIDNEMVTKKIIKTK